MAQVLFDPITGGVSTIDNQTVLAVHSLLDPQVISSSEGVPATEDDDVLQCGKCKKQFTSISIFMIHKKVCCSPVNNNGTNSAISTNITSVPQNKLVVRKIQVPSSPLTALTQSVVLTDAELLSLTAAGLDHGIGTATISACQNVQLSNTQSVSQVIPNGQAVPTAIQQVIPSLTTIPSSQQEQSHTTGLSLLTNKIVSTPVLVTSQPSSAISGVVLNISSPTAAKAALCSSSPPVSAKPDGIVLEPVAAETAEENDEKQNTPDKEQSTVNIITEFHSSMVRTRKRTPNSEIEDEAGKKGHKLNCAYCWKSFSKNFDLQQHIRCHTGEKPFQCIVCGRAFAQKSNVKKHMQTHKVWPDGLSRTLPQTYRKSFSSSSEEGGNHSERDNSQSSDHNLNDGNAIDGEETNSEELTENSYACPYCTYIGKSYFKLKSHMKQHKTEKVYKCILSTCGLMFQEIDPFLEHTKSHENEMTYRCHECNKNFPSLYDLGAHQYTHSLYPNQRTRTARRYFRCAHCLNKYSTPAALDHHMATSSHLYPCCHCDKVFPCERYLRRHLHIHAGAETYMCNMCGKGFKTETYLKIHMLIHSEDKPFQCNVCKSAFNRKDKLKRHLLVHDPVKRLKCPFRSHSGCPKEFNRPDKLKAHILTHSCIKPFVCRICGRNFTRRAHLRDHVKQHNDDQAFLYYCDFCGKNFEDQKELKNHDCADVTTLKKKKDYRAYRPGRQRKYKVLTNLGVGNISSAVKKRGRPRKHPKPGDQSKSVNINEADDITEVIDDIPTAHIEIISTTGDLVTSNSEVTHISLSPGISISDVHFQPIVTEAVTSQNIIHENAANVSNVTVATLHLSGSDALATALSQASLINQS